MNTPTITRTLASLQDRDTFTFTTDGGNRCTVVVYADGSRHYRGSYGQTHAISNESQEVFNVKTEDELTAEYDAHRALEVQGERDKAAAFAKTMRAICKLLGLTYKAPESDDADRRMMCRMGGKDGVELWAAGSSWHRNAGRISISGLLPSLTSTWGVGCNEITVSDSKTPEAIVRDIQRRVMPEYLEKLAKAKEAMDNDAAHKALTLATCKTLAKATGGELRSKDTVWAAGMPRLEVSGDQVRFEFLSVGVACALELLKVLKKHKEG